MEEAHLRRLNQKRFLNLKQAKLEYKPKFRKISVSDLLKEFNQRHTNCAEHQSIYWISMISMVSTYDLSIFVQHDNFTDKVKPIHLIRWFNSYDSI